jgi:thymidine phosphorylase
VLAVLQGDHAAPDDLRERALMLAAKVLELATAAEPGSSRARAEQILASGEAWRKFQAICDAQGGLRLPPRAPLTHVMTAARTGVCRAIDNRRIAQVAKLAGAPAAPAAGVDLHARLGTHVDAGSPLYTVHAQTPRELEYALGYAAKHLDIVRVEER